MTPRLPFALSLGACVGATALLASGVLSPRVAPADTGPSCSNGPYKICKEQKSCLERNREGWCVEWGTAYWYIKLA